MGSSEKHKKVEQALRRSLRSLFEQLARRISPAAVLACRDLYKTSFGCERYRADNKFLNIFPSTSLPCEGNILNNCYSISNASPRIASMQASALANTQASASKQTPQLSLGAAASALCPNFGSNEKVGWIIC